jgi:hypothetical protein
LINFQNSGRNEETRFDAYETGFGKEGYLNWTHGGGFKSYWKCDEKLKIV